MITTIIKQPGETRLVWPGFIDRIAGDAVVELIDAGAVAKGLVPGAPALTVVAELALGQVKVTISAGDDGERYLVTVRVGTAGGAILESEIDVAVIEATWALPGGGVPYLSIMAFVDRFGLDEVVRMTDGDGSGRIDRALLIAALADAQAIADAHLSGRYALPIDTAPPIVVLAVADLARARLYPRGAPEGVAEAAKAATRMLERIQSGAMSLGLASAQTPAAETATPVMISAGKRAYPDNLVDF